MKKSPNGSISIHKNGTANGFLPYSFKFISSCIKTVSSNVRSAGASVAGSVSGGSSDDHLKDQVLWACFDKLELCSSLVKQVLLIGYSNGFQLLDVEDASNVCELVSRRDDPVTFLQIQPLPAKSDVSEGFRKSHPMLLVVASDNTSNSGPAENGKDGLLRDGCVEPHAGNPVNSPTTVRFYSLASHNYVHILRFRSPVYMVRCSAQIVAVGLASQIYCFDALTLENKFSVLTFPITQLGSQGLTGVNIGYGSMAVGPRWLAYASNNPLLSNTGRLSPQSVSPGVSPSTSPSNGNLVARYAMESSKHLAAGLVNLGDMGYKTLSKYRHELLPDASGSPISPNASRKNGRVAANSVEMDAAGMVVVKDFMSKAIVSQFRAHTSPISALCFDPSGTLLVTASVHGNNINIFRIIPSYLQNGAGSHNYDWSASHVHLYKLHRGMTSAIIQDICFSSYSQWIAIVSSKGTCHVFVLSPFGGETGLQLVNSHADGPTLLPVLSLPWWSTSSFLTNQQSTPPPPATIALSVVSRIKNGGWLSTVSNAASSAAGKVLVPSGVVAAVFHSSLRRNMLPASLKSSALEHLLVYSPSGHLIQYELLPLLVGEQGDSSFRNGGSLVQMQEDESRVKVEPVQWWDVCRRADWPEKEESIDGYTISRGETAQELTDTSSCSGNGSKEKEHAKAPERSHWYISNAEVQLRSGRIPIWQKSKIYFYTVDVRWCEELNLSENQNGGELEIEKLPVNEIDMRHKELLPIFDHFHRIHPAWGDDRKRINGRSVASHRSIGKSEDNVEIKIKSMPIGLTEKSHAGSSMSPAYDEKELFASSPHIDLKVDEYDGTRRLNPNPVLASPPVNQRSRGIISSTSPESSVNILSYVEENHIVNSTTSARSAFLMTAPDATQIQPSPAVAADEISCLSTNQSDTTMKFIDEGQVHEDMHSLVGFGQYFQEGYCKASTNGESRKLTEVVADIDGSNSPRNKEISEENEECDDMLGGVFDFSEEG